MSHRTKREVFNKCLIPIILIIICRVFIYICVCTWTCEAISFNFSNLQNSISSKRIVSRICRQEREGRSGAMVCSWAALRTKIALHLRTVALSALFVLKKIIPQIKYKLKIRCSIIFTSQWILLVHTTEIKGIKD